MDKWINSGGKVGSTVDKKNNRLRCKYGTAHFGKTGHKETAKFVEISFVEGRAQVDAEKLTRKIFHVLPRQANAPDEENSCKKWPCVLPWPNIISGQLHDMGYIIGDEQTPDSAIEQGPRAMSKNLANGNYVHVSRRPAALNCPTTECRDLFYMDTGQHKRRSGVNGPRIYDRWRNGGGKNAVISWTIGRTGDFLERRAGKVIQADPSLPNLKYHAYVVSRATEKITSTLYHINPTRPLVNSKPGMLLRAEPALDVSSLKSAEVGARTTYETSPETAQANAGSSRFPLMHHGASKRPRCIQALEQCHDIPVKHHKIQTDSDATQSLMGMMHLIHHDA
eukprot:SAG11_NODE_119_length_15911_cov_7.077599_14_plen_337_part_00